MGSHQLRQRSEGSDFWIIAANQGPQYTLSSPTKNEFPTITSKSRFCVYSPGRARFSVLSPREVWWMQSLDFLDYFPNQDLVDLRDRYSFAQLIQLAGNAFQMRCAGHFAASVLLLDRLSGLAHHA